MKKSLLAKSGMLAIALVLVLVTPGCGVCGIVPGQVLIRDPQLELAIRNALGIPFSCITYADMLRLTDLNAAGYGIQFLDGLEAASNLVNLDLKSNFIENINPIRDLDKLVHLDLSFNGIDTLDPVAGLDSLRFLDTTCNTNIENWDPIVAVVTTNNGFLEGGRIVFDKQSSTLVTVDENGQEVEVESDAFIFAATEILNYAALNNVLIEVVLGVPGEGSEDDCGF